MESSPDGRFPAPESRNGAGTALLAGAFLSAAPEDNSCRPNNLMSEKKNQNEGCQGLQTNGENHSGVFLGNHLYWPINQQDAKFSCGMKRLASEDAEKKLVCRVLIVLFLNSFKMTSPSRAQQEK
jgi:hypothetical protein